MTQDKKTDQSAGEQKAFSPPSISLPKGGGAIRGIGEKFAANPVTGTGSMTVPIAVSPGRSGFGPQLSLSYDSGSGNGPFGFGWNLSLPSITRKTDKGLPLYQDESDVFVLSGAEDLVPIPEPDGCRLGDDYTIHRYRPRIEGLFARIERWVDNKTGDTHWRSISKSNILTIYGQTDNARIAEPVDPNDPDKPTRIFSWVIQASYDDKGNGIHYTYKPEDGERVTDKNYLHESNRSDGDRSANRYIERIQYGNTIPFNRKDLSEKNEWLFEVIFDYGENYTTDNNGNPVPGQKWLLRQDPFSSYRAGFEVRTYRLCQQVLMFHHFQGEDGYCGLVKSTDFQYDKSPVASFIISATQTGYKKQQDGAYLKKSLPPVEFTYSKPTIDPEIREIDAESLENMPCGLDGAAYQWIDLDGEGVSGILVDQANTWFYKPNHSPARLEYDPKTRRNTTEIDFKPMRQVRRRPNAAIAEGRARLMDLAGDGQLDVVELDGPVTGFYERTHDENWEPFRPFESLPSIPWDDPNLRMVDLNGDGHADALITEHDVFTWYPSLGEKGFDSARYVRKPWDEESGPRLVFADGTQSVYLADMAGDGLTDLVRIRNGEVCYWPNLGYGRFGARVVMGNAPWFDAFDQFDQKHIRLADIDGSGNIDIIYLGGDGVRLYFNQSGNSWSDPQDLPFPPVDNLSSVMTADLYGNGTACLVWSSPLPGNTHSPMRYVDLMGGQKPHLLVMVKNNLGAETHIAYAPSTKYYIKDKEAGTPWITKLPFPVHVVERVEICDRISGNRFVTSYTYHHGYFDGVEREFRGFGRVEQRDTEFFEALAENPGLAEATNMEEKYHVPPVVTKTWFHTGAWLQEAMISLQFKDEYYREPHISDNRFDAMLLPDTILPNKRRLPEGKSDDYDLTPDEMREACRALKGSVLRQEIYARDPSGKSEHPYTVSERNYTIELLQPKGVNEHAVFFAHPRETIDYHYERTLHPVDPNDPDSLCVPDPRVTHELILETDNYGNVLKSVAIGYGRRDKITVVDEHDNIIKVSNPGLKKLDSKDQKIQTRTLITYTENVFTNPIDKKVNDPDYNPNNYRTPLPSEIRTYEITGPDLKKVNERFPFSQVAGIVNSCQSIQYEKSPNNSSWQKRLIEHERTLYRENKLEGPLKLREMESMAIPFESYKLAFTPGLLDDVYERDENGNEEPLFPYPAFVLGINGGYVPSDGLKTSGLFPNTDMDGNWWIPSGQIFYSLNEKDTPEDELKNAKNTFFQPHRFCDPFGQTTTVKYDNYTLLVWETCDPLGNTAAAKLDYRVLQPWEMTGPNGNQTAVAFDTLGLVAATAVMGKNGEGDSLPRDYQADLPEDQLVSFFKDPKTAQDLLGSVTSRIIYDMNCFHSTQNLPVYAATITRDIHVSDLPNLPPDRKIRILASFTYSDGFGREIQQKIPAEPESPESNDPRWVGSGWTVFNNKGKPVRQFEPFFTDTHCFEFDAKNGVSPVLFYDPLARVVATLHPNNTYEKVVFDPWMQETWDVNDTVKLDPKTDGDVKIYTEEYFKTQPEEWQTWLQMKIPDPENPPKDSLGLPPEQAAAVRTLPHANTPTAAHFDTLGRVFLTVADNRMDKDDKSQLYETRVVLDIEGNQREVIDARGRIVMKYEYDMLGNRISQNSMDAGRRWNLPNVAGNVIRTWDDRNFERRMTYDELQRPVGVYVSENGGSEFLAEKMVYGDTPDVLENPEATNHRGQVYKIYDAAGVVTQDAYDFKGNPLQSTRQLLVNYKDQVDWDQSPKREDETFTGKTVYDALNRPIQIIAPHSDRPGTKINFIQPEYNEANLFEKEHVWLDQENEPDGLLESKTADQHIVENIDYDAKGQRTLIEYGNGVKTAYAYDEETFRLTNLSTERPHPNPNKRKLQDLSYTYDPVGNITHIQDQAQQRIFFDNAIIDPSNDYKYDPIYRLIAASGRELKGRDLQPNWDDSPRFETGIPSNCNEVRNYVEKYEYDEVGNILKMGHHAGDNIEKPGQAVWNRLYQYDPDNNQLRCTSIPGEDELPFYSTDTLQYSHRYTYDAHGNMTTMPHLPIMNWNFRDELQATSKQNVTSGCTPEMTYNVYDSNGQRVRKVTERHAPPGCDPARKQERIYLDGFEIYRKFEGDGVTENLERETFHVMDDGQRIALIETRSQGNEPGVPRQLVRYQFGNHLGSASLELDSQAQIISYEEYAPYGNTAYQAVQRQIETPKRYRYTGKERDEESGLYYNGARYYAPCLGRWPCTDPAQTVDGPNLYQYALDSPIRYSDPDGMQHFEQGTVDDPAVSGCTGGECYVNIRQSRFRELQRRARGRQQSETGAAIANNPLSTIFWGIARLSTDDPNKQHAAAQLGVAAFGLVMAFGGVQVGRQQMQSVVSAQPLRPVAAEIRPANPPASRTSPSHPSRVQPNSSGPPVAPSSGGQPRRPPLDVLVVGAETRAEFDYAQRVSQRRGNITVVNPRVTSAARGYQQAGGNFVRGKIEDLPASTRFNLIREDYPFPLGRAFSPSQQFVEARLGRLKPGGTWVVATESSEFVQALEAAGTLANARVAVHQIPRMHEATPQSSYPREENRYVVTFSR